MTNIENTILKILNKLIKMLYIIFLTFAINDVVKYKNNNNF